MRGRVAFGFAACGVAWCLFLLAAAFFVPMYSTIQSPGGSGGALSNGASSETAFAVNGWLIIWWLGGVVLVSVLVLAALHHVCTHELDAAKVVAWCGILLLFFFCVLTGLSIGVTIVPAVALLAVSALLTEPASAQPG